MENVYEIIRGDSEAMEIEFVDDDTCTPIDITGYTVFFTVKKNILEPDDKAAIKKEIVLHSDPINGKTILTLSTSDTNLKPGNYVWDLQIKSPSNDINSCRAGTFIVYADVTKRTS